MPSVVQELDELLAAERGEIEALSVVVTEHGKTDPDIAGGARHAMETDAWCCSGLTHRIMHLGGTPTLDSTDLASRVGDLPDLRTKLQLISRDGRKDRMRAKALLQRSDLDPDTRTFIEDLLRAHETNAHWLADTLKQWEPDVETRPRSRQA